MTDEKKEEEATEPQEATIGVKLAADKVTISRQEGGNGLFILAIPLNVVDRLGALGAIQEFDRQLKQLYTAIDAMKNKKAPSLREKIMSGIRGKGEA